MHPSSLSAIVAALPNPSLALSAASPELRRQMCCHSALPAAAAAVSSHNNTCHSLLAASRATLTSLTISTLDANIDFTAVGTLQQLTSLRVMSVAVDVENMDWMAGCISLEQLQINKCKHMSDFSAIGGLKNLKDLDLSRTCVDIIDWIDGCHSALPAAAAAVSSHNNTCHSLLAASRATLTSLTISTLDANIDFTAVGTLQQLTSLRVMSVAVDVENMDWMAGCISLEQLQINKCKHMSDFSAIGGLKNLKDLDLSRTCVDTIDWIDGCRYLEKLKIRRCKCLANFYSIGRLQNLMALDMSKTYVDDIGFISRCTTLETFIINECQEISDFRPIGSLHNLKVLDMATTLVNDMAWIKKDCKSIERLNICQCRDIADFSAMRTLKSLRYLDMSCTHPHDMSWADHCSTLVEVNLYECRGASINKTKWEEVEGCPGVYRKKEENMYI